MKVKTRCGLFSLSSHVCLAHTRSYMSCSLCGQALSLPCTVWHGLDLLPFLPYRFSCFIEKMPCLIRHSCRASTEAQIPSIRRCRIIHPSSRKQPHCSRSTFRYTGAGTDPVFCEGNNLLHTVRRCYGQPFHVLHEMRCKTKKRSGMITGHIAFYSDK